MDNETTFEDLRANKMTDTPLHIRKKQNEIWLSKSPQERVRLGANMIDEAFHFAKMTIKNQNPAISEKDLKIKIFLQFYRNDFSQDELTKITASF